MIILSAIGRFFKKIWDWIKQTAWIQPLLIVGLIFGIIFSIPTIVKAVNKGKQERSSYNTYYHNYKLSLEVSAKDARDSEADKFTTDLTEVFEGNAENFHKDFPELEDKFFVAFVAKDCDKCEDAKEGFATFEKKLNDGYYTGVTDKFHLVTIFTDDENKDTEENQTAFVKYLEHHQDFFEHAASVAYETAYAHNDKINEADIYAMETADPDTFLTPTILLVEIGEKAGTNYQGVTEVMFGVEGSDKNDKARTLLDCWKHEGDFSDIGKVE